jgi:8-oxo-dGTP diphosphatase
MLKFFTRCLHRKTDSITVCDKDGHVLVKTSDDDKINNILLSKASSLDLASRILTHYGKEAPDYREYGVFAIPYFPQEGKIVFLIRADGKLGFPGGKVEKGEEHIQALVREVLEEVGFVLCRGNLSELCTDFVQGIFYSKCYIYETQSSVYNFLKDFDGASHRKESNGFLVVDATPKAINDIIKNYPLASTVDKELNKFLDSIDKK